MAKKVNTGIYKMEAHGRTFWIERVTDGTWQLTEELGYGTDYWNHFATKAAAIAAVKSELSL